MFSKIKSFMTKLIAKRRFCVSVLAVLSACVITFVGVSVNAATVYDANGEHVLYSLANRPVDMKPITYNVFSSTADDEAVNMSRRVNITAENDIPVHVTMGNETVTVFAHTGQTVSDAIGLSGFRIDEHDSVNLDLLSVIVDTEYIDILDIEYVTNTFEEEIPYGIKTKYSKNLASTTIKSGKNGVKEVTCVTKLINGVESERSIVKEKVLKKAVDEVVTVGMKYGTTYDALDCISTLKPKTNIRLDKNGVPVEYKKHVTVQATAYTYTGHNCASGVKPQPGYVAVNTNIFPFGTKFFIKSSDGKYIYGYAVAADTGGFLKTRPTNFDLFFETEAQCRAFGRRNIEVYVLY
ncbi:MAG: G5 domain-containing protein [Acutalibacteraceae bacterium]|nr:G5 domain-containing protein [Acutalibacteraceae bacterium]